MPRYFIDLHDGANFVKDEAGFEVPDIDAARARAFGVVIRYGRDLRPNVERQDLFLIVRDENASVVLRAHMALDFEVLERV